MPKDDRTFIKVHDGMPDHPKIVGLSDKAFRLLVELWCYSSRHLTDGIVPVAYARKRGPKAVNELAAAGLLDEATPAGYDCHDYLDHQRSRDHIQAIKEKRRESGRRGGRPKANQNQIGKQNESKGQSQKNPETEEVLRTSQTETEQPPVVPLAETADAKPRKPTGRKRPARPLPDDWKPGDTHLAICRERGLDPALELANFRDHARANDRRQVDWDASFRTWLRKADPSRSRRAQPETTPAYWRKPSP